LDSNKANKNIETPIYKFVELKFCIISLKEVISHFEWKLAPKNTKAAAPGIIPIKVANI
jgi:Tfp pilus assembly ATPase PilU